MTAPDPPTACCGDPTALAALDVALQLCAGFPPGTEGPKPYTSRAALEDILPVSDSEAEYAARWYETQVEAVWR